MERLCERPGCSDLASVSYGMRASDLVFWLDSLGDDDDRSHGVLCRRHADSMVVPSNWTLDDIRDPDLRLFRPPEAGPQEAPPRRRSPRRAPADQLDLGIASDAPAAGRSEGEPDPGADTANSDTANTDTAVTDAAVTDAANTDAAVTDAAVTDAAVTDTGASNGVPAEAGIPVAGAVDAAPDPWTPAFDNADDLDGLLAARSPLLARAFRGADRPRPS